MRNVLMVAIACILAIPMPAAALCQRLCGGMDLQPGELRYAQGLQAQGVSLDGPAGYARPIAHFAMQQVISGLQCTEAPFGVLGYVGVANFYVTSLPFGDFLAAHNPPRITTMACGFSPADPSCSNLMINHRTPTGPNSIYIVGSKPTDSTIASVGIVCCINSCDAL